MEYVNLLEEGGRVLPIRLYREPGIYAPETVLKACQNAGVRENLTYGVQVDPEDTVMEMALSLNGKPVNGYFDPAGGIFHSNGPLFAYYMGLVELEITLKRKNGEQETLYSEWLPVLISPSRQQKNLKSMLETIYAHQEVLLAAKGEQKASGEAAPVQDFRSSLQLLEDILHIYEESYGFFKANCRSALAAKEVVDWTEKVQQVNARSLRYLVQHPEYLRQSVDGISWAEKHYLPEKMLMPQHQISRDVYENQVVLGFLQRLLFDLEEMDKEIQSVLETLDLPERTRDGYLLSSYVLYENAQEKVRDFRKTCRELEEKARELLGLYTSILPVSPLDCRTQPEPTEPFFRTPQYRRIYWCIHRWYKQTDRHFPRENMLLGLYENTFVYEVYVLVKLLLWTRGLGYQLTGASRQDYGRRDPRGAAYHNVFEFAKKGESLTLYFQPVLSDADEGEKTGIHLYRSTTYAYRALEEGHYYTPDYVLKWQQGYKENYLILDAKYSYKRKVLQELMPEMTYKYLLSLAPIRYQKDGKPVEVTIKGMNIFYALTNEDTELESFYNRQLPGQAISPIANVIPLSEDVPMAAQKKEAQQLLGALVKP